LEPDIVHGQGTERECALGAVFSGFPNLITIHGNVRAIARSTNARIGSYWWWAAMFERVALPRTDGVFCNSVHTRSLVQPLAKETWLVPNPLRRAFFDTPLSQRRASSPILLNIGTISPLKRQLALLELMEELHRQGHAFELRFIGAADPRNDYAAAFLQHIKKAECQRFARYLGTKLPPELIAALDDASAIVHVPFEEAFGLAVAEALTRNLKFFGTNVGGLRDIANGVEGAELYPLEDSRGLSAAIGNWLHTGFTRPQTAGLQMKQRYHPDIIANRHAEIYREITSRSS
jgi:glycosyltransferase involved in cell wall biosynthesis